MITTLIKRLIVVALWAGILLVALCAWYAQELPAITKNATFERKISIIVKAIDGTIIGRYGDLKGENVAVQDLPPNLVHAVLAIEDRRFYSHWGIDFTGVARAIATNLIHGRISQGGSTLTQQLAKNLFLNQQRTFKRKIQEAMLALWLEHQLTKDEILSAYMNRVYLGGGTYGVAAASKLYFNKDVKDLNLRECATLAALLKAPSRYSPIENPQLSQDRTNTVLAAMVDAGYITPDQAKNATTSTPATPKPPTGDSARYYTDWIVDNLQDIIGAPQEDIVVQTTMDPAIQHVAQDALVNTIAANGKDRLISQGAVVVMRPDGAVLAMVGGDNYTVSQFNRASQARRQPGSSFKPIVYLTALENGWNPQDVILDAPIEDGKYRPKNFGGDYYGEVTLETALMLSLNTVTFRLIKAIGPQKVVDMAHRLGINEDLQPDLSLGLGTASLSPLEMVTAYAVLANGGTAIRNYAITKITNTKGDLYYSRQPPEDSMRVVAPTYLNELTMMMQNVIEYGTGQRAKLPFPAYGKTGTSQDSRDAWFIGFTPELVTGVWMGNDDYSPMKKVTGGSFPADVWKAVMAFAHGRYAAARSVDSDSANLAPPTTPAPADQPSGFQNLINNIVGRQSDAAPEAQPRAQPRRAPRIPSSARYND